jgi:hypothetical protein
MQPGVVYRGFSASPAQQGSAVLIRLLWYASAPVRVPERMFRDVGDTLSTNTLALTEDGCLQCPKKHFEEVAGALLRTLPRYPPLRGSAHVHHSAEQGHAYDCAGRRDSK